MAKTGMNLQDSFLNQVRKDNTEITLVMLDGTKLSGLVRGFDNFTVILNSRGSQHLIYKHAIAQIVSRRASHGGEGEHGGGEQQGGGHQGGEQRREPRGDQRPPRPQQSGGPGGAQSSAPAPATPVAPTHPAGASPTEAAGAQGVGPQAGSAPPPQQRPQGGERRQDQGQQRRGEDPHSRDKFNTLDLSSLKVDESKPEA